ncbi:hypothetical protein PFISCL1PPCAC_3169, partial [Pristionchus fissidentatus]
MAYDYSECAHKRGLDDFKSYHAVGDFILCAMLITYIARNSQLREKYMKNFLVIVLVQMFLAAVQLTYDVAFYGRCWTKQAPRLTVFVQIICLIVVRTTPSFTMGALLCLRISI